MSEDLISDAFDIANRWELVGAKLPRSVQTDLDKLKAVRAVRLDPAEVSTEFAPEDAAKVVDDLAYELSLGDGVQGIAKPASHRSVARSQLMRRLASTVIAGAVEAVPSAIESIRPDFDAAVSEYTDAIAKLPDGPITSDVIVNAGPDVTGAFLEAKAAAATLSAYDAWVSSLRSLGVAGDFSPQTRITDPETESDYAELSVAQANSGSAPTTEQALNPVWLTAVRRSVPFRLLGGSERVQDGVQRKWANPYALGPGVNF